MPATLEFVDAATRRLIEDYLHAGLPVDAAALLLIEVDGPPEEVAREAEAAERVCVEHGGLVECADDEEDRDRLWAARRAAHPSLVNTGRRVITEDATVPCSRVPEMLAAVEEIATRHRVTIATAGHAGDGNLHPSLLVDPRDQGEMERARAAIEEIFDAALRPGGTLSGEHGIGSVKAPLLGRQLGETGLEVIRAIKDALDPQNTLNPGKFVP